MRLAVSVSVAKRTNSLVLRLLVCVEFQRSLLGVLRSVSSALVLSGFAVCLQAPQRQGHMVSATLALLRSRALLTPQVRNAPNEY